MRVAVTGAAGFVGAAVCADLEARGHDVVRVVRRPLPGFPDAVQWNLTQDAPASVPDGTWTVDAVVHCAATPATSDRAGVMEAVHVDGTRRVWDAWPGARLVFMSSASVYPHSEGRPMTEADVAPLPLASPYARTKFAAEEWLREAAERDGREAIILRPSAIHGPGDRHLLPRLRKMVVGPLLFLPDAGRHLWSVTDVRTLVAVTAAAVERGLPASSTAHVTLSVADEPARPFGAVLKELLEADAGRRLRVVPIPGGLLRVAGAASEALWAALRLRGEPSVTREAVAYVTHERVLDLAALRASGYAS